MFTVFDCIENIIISNLNKVFAAINLRRKNGVIDNILQPKNCYNTTDDFIKAYHKHCSITLTILLTDTSIKAELT